MSTSSFILFVPLSLSFELKAFRLFRAFIYHVVSLRSQRAEAGGTVLTHQELGGKIRSARSFVANLGSQGRIWKVNTDTLPE